MGRDAFISRLPLKWTVSITRIEHMLYIILSSEYKSSWKRGSRAGSFRKIGHSQLNAARVKVDATQRMTFGLFCENKYNKLKSYTFEVDPTSSYCTCQNVREKHGCETREQGFA